MEVLSMAVVFKPKFQKHFFPYFELPSSDVKPHPIDPNTFSQDFWTTIGITYSTQSPVEAPHAGDGIPPYSVL